MNATMMPMPEKPSGLLGAPGSRKRLQGGVDIIELPEQDQEAACGEQGPHAIPDGGQHDGTRDRLKATHDPDNGLQSVAADMIDCRQIEYQVQRAIVGSRFHQFIQFASQQFVDIALGPKDGNRPVAFNGYRHGSLGSLARDDCRRVLMKVHVNSI